MDILAGLNKPPHCPHGMRRGAPRPHGLLKFGELTLARCRREVREGRCVGRDAIGEVRGEERAPLSVIRIARQVKHVGCWAVVVGCPLVKMVRNVECGWVCGSILEVDDDNLFMDFKKISESVIQAEKRVSEPDGGRVLLP